ncbi:uncharacterized protein LOC129723667 [Wyeomyia smithii]|uniref:uncharacterized protein LOC129723667 n=1 Tax=Wyeomyia smithii TaxID=174621 RepID=UPI002467B75A|nr:uncharacterized protein LOC129723667 [Wyeomyia smithii]
MRWIGIPILAVVACILAPIQSQDLTDDQIEEYIREHLPPRELICPLLDDITEWCYSGDSQKISSDFIQSRDEVCPYVPNLKQWCLQREIFPNPINFHWSRDETAVGDSVQMVLKLINPICPSYIVKLKRFGPIQRY